MKAWKHSFQIVPTNTKLTYRIRQTINGQQNLPTENSKYRFFFLTIKHPNHSLQPTKLYTKERWNIGEFKHRILSVNFYQSSAFNMMLIGLGNKLCYYITVSLSNYKGKKADPLKYTGSFQERKNPNWEIKISKTHSIHIQQNNLIPTNNASNPNLGQINPKKKRSLPHSNHTDTKIAPKDHTFQQAITKTPSKKDTLSTKTANPFQIKPEISKLKHQIDIVSQKTR